MLGWDSGDPELTYAYNTLYTRSAAIQYAICMFFELRSKYDYSKMVTDKTLTDSFQFILRVLVHSPRRVERMKVSNQMLPMRRE